MEKKVEYKLSPADSAGVGLALSGVMSTNLVTAPFASQAGTAATGALGGVVLTKVEKNIKEKYYGEMNKTFLRIIVNVKQ